MLQSLNLDYSHQIIAFDLDGTLLNSSRKVSDADRITLKSLKKPNIIRVAATGRNYYSVNRILEPEFPVDYIVFSSGAGIMHWDSKQVVYSQHIAKNDIERVINTIEPYQLNFTVNKAIPENHHMLLNSSHPNSHDLLAYTSFYKDFLEPLDLNSLPDIATQIIVLLNSHVQLFNEFKTKLSPLKTILTTSPVNHSSMWMEVFHSSVSKSKGLQWLSQYLNIDKAYYFAIGNDYNDLDMLTFAHDSFVVANAPIELRKKFRITKSNNNSGFTHAIKSVNI